MITGFPSGPVTVSLAVYTPCFAYVNDGFSGLFGHLAVGHINFILIILLGGSAAIGALIGPRLLKRIKTDVLDKWFKIIFIILLTLMGLMIIIK